MKLKYFIPSLMAVIAAVFTGCSDDNDPTYLDEIRVSQSYVSLDTNGGSTTITVTTSSDWNFEKIFQKITTNADGKKDTTYVESPDWLTINKVSGEQGVSEVTFSAGEGVGRTAELVIACAGKTQRINIIQGIAEVAVATCADVINGPDSKTYRVTGTVTRIVNTTYGNWYLTDETGEIYIYGTLDSKGGTKNFLSWGLEVGDQITVEGPKTTYNGTVELVDVTVLNIEKSLIKVDSLSIEDGTLPIEGGDITAYLTCKGNGVAVEIPADAKDWLGVTSSTVGDVPTVTFHATANTGGDRTTTVTFKTTDGKKTYTSEATISQKGAIIACSIADFNAAEVSETIYRLTGVITKVANAGYGNYYIRDYSGETYVYGTGAKGDFEAKGLKAGDVVTITGKRGVYKETIEVLNSEVENIISVQEVTIAEFLAKPVASDVYYMVSGTVTKIANETYGNLYLTDGTNEVYVYGCYPGWGATGDFRKNCIATEGIEVGDKLTVIGPRGQYNGTDQVNGGIYFSHTKAE